MITIILSFNFSSSRLYIIIVYVIITYNYSCAPFPAGRKQNGAEK